MKTNTYIITSTSNKSTQLFCREEILDYDGITCTVDRLIPTTDYTTKGLPLGSINCYDERTPVANAFKEVAHRGNQTKENIRCIVMPGRYELEQMIHFQNKELGNSIIFKGVNYVDNQVGTSMGSFVDQTVSSPLEEATRPRKSFSKTSLFHLGLARDVHFQNLLFYPIKRLPWAVSSVSELKNEETIKMNGLFTNPQNQYQLASGWR